MLFSKITSIKPDSSIKIEIYMYILQKIKTNNIFTKKLDNNNNGCTQRCNSYKKCNVFISIWCSAQSKYVKNSKTEWTPTIIIQHIYTYGLMPILKVEVPKVHR